MRIVTRPEELESRSPQVGALVPTMGALHEGHLTLIRKAREIAGPDRQVAVSIFVNPIQFDRPDDLNAYPRPLEDDLEACRKEGVDLVFIPEADAMYASDSSTKVIESSLATTLCGATRPGHFDGVCTVVLKLFNLIQPEAAVFGEKDFQQLAIIRRMVRDLNVPVEVIGHPTLREADGLALSSRNQRLSTEQRADAPRIHAAMLAAAREGRVCDVLQSARQGIESPLNEVDYLELVDVETLQPVDTLDRPALLATAVFYGQVRLIDNLTISPHS
ncbi:MAG: pantoate--beta-alanine ligase [Haloferula sp.]